MKQITLDSNSNSSVAAVPEIIPATGSIASLNQFEQPEYIDAPTPLFRHWINNEISSNFPDLPSGVLPTILGKRFQLVDGKPKGNFIEIAGMKFLKLNSITAAESLFARWLIQKVTTKQGEMNATIRSLAAALREAYPEDKLAYKDSVTLVYNILNSKADEKYEPFADTHNQTIMDLFKLANTATDEGTQNLLRATFMITQRIDPDWSVADSLQLTQTEIDEISLFWDTENNKGVVPVKEVEPPKVEDKPEDEPAAESSEEEAQEEAKKEES